MSSRSRFVCAVGTVLVASLPFSALGETVLLLSSRSGWVEFVDLTTLHSKGRLLTGPMTESVDASPDGRTLLIRKAPPTNPQGCCSLFALRLSTSRTEELLSISTAAVVAERANRILDQRGNVGIEVFQSNTLSRLPKMDAPSVYRLYPSPDGHWLFGATESAVDIFDLRTARMVRHINVPSHAFLTGTWRGSTFFLYAQEQDHARFWSISPETFKLGTEVTVPLPGAPRSSFQLWDIGTADQHLFVYERYGTPFDDRSSSETTQAGGLYEIDVTEGTVIRSLVPSFHFSTIKCSTDGSKFYGIDLSTENWEGVRLVKVDAESGNVEAVRELPSGVAQLSLADIPTELIPKN